MEKQDIVQKIINDNTIAFYPGKMLDNNNAHVMVEVITEAHAQGHKFVIVDLAETEFLSSAGVGSILGTVELFRAAGGDIILCNVAPTIMHVLEVLDLVDYLTVKSDIHEASTKCNAGV